MESERSLHYTKGDGYYEEYKEDRSFVEYGLKPFTTDGKEISESDLVRQKKWIISLAEVFSPSIIPTTD